MVQDVSFLFVCVGLLSFFLGPHPRHMEVPRLRVKSELLLLAYATVTATPDPSLVCDLHHSSRQWRILDPMSKARDQTPNLMVPSRIHYPLCHNGNSHVVYFFRMSFIFAWLICRCSLNILDINPWSIADLGNVCILRSSVYQLVHGFFQIFMFWNQIYMYFYDIYFYFLFI